MRRVWVPLLLATILLAADRGFARPRQRRFEIRYVAQVWEIPRGAEGLRLWIPVPSGDEHQEITHLRAESPFPYTITREARFGNRMVFLDVARPPRCLQVTLRYRVRRREITGDNRSAGGLRLLSRSLHPNALVPRNDEARALARSVVGGRTDPVERGRALYRHALDHLTYDKSLAGWGRGDFTRACRLGRGNCTDYHAYFIGLARSVGLPAFFEIGLSVPSETASGEIGGYHCWAFFRARGVWMPLDISEADKHPEKARYFFGNLDEHRVALARGRDLILSPPQAGPPCNFFVYPYAEVDGAVHHDLRKRSFFRALR